MSEGKSVWISVHDATLVARRKPRTIYSWGEKGHVRTRRNAQGILEFHGADVLKAEATLRRGRPVGSARPSQR